MGNNIKTKFKICNCNKNHGFSLFTIFCDNNEHGIMGKNIKTKFKICNCNKNYSFALFTIFCENNEHGIIGKKSLCLFTKINALNKLNWPFSLIG